MQPIFTEEKKMRKDAFSSYFSAMRKKCRERRAYAYRQVFFQNNYEQFKGKVKEAFNFLMKNKGGDLSLHQGCFSY